MYHYLYIHRILASCHFLYERSKYRIKSNCLGKSVNVPLEGELFIRIIPRDCLCSVAWRGCSGVFRRSCARCMRELRVRLCFCFRFEAFPATCPFPKVHNIQHKTSERVSVLYHACSTTRSIILLSVSDTGRCHLYPLHLYKPYCSGSHCFRFRTSSTVAR